MESIIIGLELMGYGLGGTFLALILLYIILRVTGPLFPEKSDESKKEQ